LQLGAEVYGISSDIPTQPSLFESLKLNERMKHYEADVRDAEAVRRIID
jgi:CDP-glucose 4,6-dehydratase